MTELKPKTEEKTMNESTLLASRSSKSCNTADVMKIMDIIYNMNLGNVTAGTTAYFDVLIKKGTTVQVYVPVKVRLKEEHTYSVKVSVASCTNVSGFAMGAVSINAEASGVKNFYVYVPIQYLRNMGYDYVRVNYGRCVTIDTYAELTEQCAIPKKNHHGAICDKLRDLIKELEEC